MRQGWPDHKCLVRPETELGSIVSDVDVVLVDKFTTMFPSHLAIRQSYDLPTFLPSNVSFGVPPVFFFTTFTFFFSPTSVLRLAFTSL